MKDELLGQAVRDRRTGLVGTVVGVVEWIDQVPSVIIQPPARPDRTVPPTAYAPRGSVDPIPEALPELRQ